MPQEPSTKPNAEALAALSDEVQRYLDYLSGRLNEVIEKVNEIEARIAPLGLTRNGQ